MCQNRSRCHKHRVGTDLVLMHYGMLSFIIYIVPTTRLPIGVVLGAWNSLAKAASTRTLTGKQILPSGHGPDARTLCDTGIEAPFHECPVTVTSQSDEFRPHRNRPMTPNVQLVWNPWSDVCRGRLLRWNLRPVSSLPTDCPEKLPLILVTMVTRQTCHPTLYSCWQAAKENP